MDALDRKRLEERLAEVARQTSERHRKERVREGRAEVWRAVPGLLLVLPAALAALNIGAWAAGRGVLLLPMWALVACGLGPLLIAALAWPLWRRGAAMDRRLALLEADGRLGTEGRLSAAAEFLDREERTAFEEAALLDAADTARALDLASELDPAEIDVVRPRRRGPVLAFVLAIALLVFVARFAPPTPERPSLPERAGEPDLVAEVSEPEGREDAARAPEESVQPPAPPAKPRQTRPRARAGETEPTQAEAQELPEEARESVGTSGRGQSSKALASRGSSPSRGSPSSEGAKSSGEQPDPKKSNKKPKPKKDRPEEKIPPEKMEQSSGATAGRGSGSGSQRNPVGTDWASKDQVVTDEEDDLEEDEEVDDEEDSSESRGGMQPNLRDRRPPVSRDLSIGFGNKPSPDANGRGGPSQQKKSRGTASLVLGVPVPDHVKGRPNPGRTKVTQERVEPRFEESAPAVASPRGERQQPVRPSPRPEVEAWGRRSVERYFLELRRRAARSGPGTPED